MALENKKTFVVITGASRGIGRTLAEHLSAVLSPGSLLLLIARDEKELNSVKAVIEEHHPTIKISVCPTDLSSCDESTLDQIFNCVDPQSYDHAICVHNVGSLGDASKRCTDLFEMKDVLDYFQLNLASVIVLNAFFFRTFGNNSRVNKTIVNITSLCGIEAFPSFSLYSTGKAAREMFFKVIFNFSFLNILQIYKKIIFLFFKVLAKEEPNVRVLNYSPGPVETDMRTQLLNQSFFQEIKNGQALTTDMTCSRLIQLLQENKFPSGAHIDYFDPTLE